MKRILSFLLLCSFYTAGRAQNATLTKGETVEYLAKKLTETNGQTAPGSTTVFDISAYMPVKLNSTTLEVNFRYKSPFKSYTYSFNPAYIKEISQTTGNPSIGWVKIIMSNKSGVENVEYTNPSKQSVDTVWIPFLLGDGANFDKIKKALLHLQALLKAEDDPFK